MELSKAKSSFFSKVFDITFIRNILALLFVLIIIHTFNISTSIKALFVILFSVISIYKAKQSRPLLIITAFIAYSNYSICLYTYLFDNESLYTTYVNTPIAETGINILFFFTIGLMISVPNTNVQKANSSIFEIRKEDQNPLIVFAGLAACIFVYLTQFHQGVSGERGSYSSYFEYLSIVLICIFYFSGGNRKLLSIIVSMSAFLSLMVLFNGGRAAGIEIFFILFLFMFNKKSISLPYTILFSVLLLTCFVIGRVRGNLLNESFLDTTIEVLMENPFFTMDTAYSAYHTSLSFLDVLETTPPQEMFYLRLQYFKYIFLGSSVPDSNLSVYTSQIVAHSFGGVLPFYFYFYFGYCGIIVCLLYLRTLFLLFNSDFQDNIIMRIMLAYFSISVLRWYLYSPSPIIRAFFIILIFGTTLKLLHNATSKNTLSHCSE